MEKYLIPGRDDVSASDQVLFDTLEKRIGFVPNLYAYYAKNATALTDLLALENRKSSLNAKEKEVVNLVVSQYNGCKYCVSAHTQLALKRGFSDEQILEIRKGSATFDPKLHALAEFSLELSSKNGKVSEATKEQFFEAGYSEANMIDVVVLAGGRTMANYIHNLVGFEIDWPLAPGLE
ncbi:carboxymuconolactone decarboxylase family protein [Marinoscillum sp. 108]|uniref:carboxymuconolactone decarboxylase family protein n=1 Tax=Marinoscillum sp. 108 TaxID=2653151 RepID=UPI0012F0EEE0|nr:carboxymuconolactone decarboxylase family protein [Marinoscillum sp. 108]VXD14590.1 Alkyl hydroperoxide reductase AhpD [Marinoscillum sp. 108]